jgi:hypothetical protein
LKTFDFINNITSVDTRPNDHPEQHFHGTQTLSTIGAFEKGVFTGKKIN